MIGNDLKFGNDLYFKVFLAFSFENNRLPPFNNNNNDIYPNIPSHTQNVNRILFT